MKLLAYFRSIGSKFFAVPKFRRRWNKNSAATLHFAPKTWNVPAYHGGSGAAGAHRIRREEKVKEECHQALGGNLIETASMTCV